MQGFFLKIQLNSRFFNLFQTQIEKSNQVRGTHQDTFVASLGSIIIHNPKWLITWFNIST